VVQAVDLCEVVGPILRRGLEVGVPLQGGDAECGSGCRERLVGVELG
jgi:hypothetical protein